MQSIESKNWRCDKWVNELRCCSKTDPDYKERKDCFVQDTVAFVDEEGSWTAPYVSIPTLMKVKCLKESGSKLCYTPRDLAEYDRWDNDLLNQLKTKRPQVM